MNFKVDENLPVEVADLLRSAGHDAATVLEQNLGGAADNQLAIICHQEERTIVTLALVGKLWIIDEERIRIRE